MKTLSLCTQIHLCVCRFDVCECIHEPAYVARVLEAIKDKFFLTLKLRFGMNPTSFGNHSKPSFFKYIMPNMVYFKNTQKIIKENRRFTRNSELKRKFFTIYSQVYFLLIETFSSLDLWVLKFTNQFYLVVNRFDWGNGQNQAKELLFLRYTF